MSKIANKQIGTLTRDYHEAIFIHELSQQYLNKNLDKCFYELCLGLSDNTLSDTTSARCLLFTYIDYKFKGNLNKLELVAFIARLFIELTPMIILF